MKALTAIASALPTSLWATAALAGYGGNWPLTVTHSQRADGTYCLTLKDQGDLGWPHSGEASLVGQRTGSLPYGTFQVIGHTLMVTIEQSGDSGQNAGLVFIAPASKGDVDKGVYEQVYGGTEFDSGEVAFGRKGGC